MSKKCTPLWSEARAHLQVQNTSAPDCFWKLRGQKSQCCCGGKHILSQHVKIAICSDQLWTLSRCRKIARHCGAKHVSKSKVLKITSFEPILKCQLTSATKFSNSTGSTYNNYSTYNTCNKYNNYNTCNTYNKYNNYNSYYNY